MSVARKFALAAALAVLIFAAPSVKAQGDGGARHGRVTDAAGAVIPNAQITVTAESTQVVLSAQSNSAGDYVL